MKTLLIALALGTGLAAQQPFQIQVTGHGRPVISVDITVSGGLLVNLRGGRKVEMSRRRQSVRMREILSL
jgi:hypothetical protein